MTYGERLQEALGLAGRDRKDLARHLEVSVQAIGQIVNGPGQLTAFNSAHAAKYLKVDHHWLATGDGEPRPKAALSSIAESIGRAFDNRVPEALREATYAQILGAIMFAEEAGRASTPAPAPSERPRLDQKTPPAAPR